MEVNRVWTERQHKLFCEHSYSLHWIWIVFSIWLWASVCECVCTCPLFTHQKHRRYQTTHFISLLSHHQHLISFSFSSCHPNKHTLSSPAFISTSRHEIAQNSLFATLATCTDSPPLTTYTPSVMFYKHILNNSAHPHLPNGLFFPEAAWLLFASSCLSFSSCLLLFLCLLSPSFFSLPLCLTYNVF